MAVFRYEAMMRREGEEITESGSIVGTDEREATAKLNQYGFNKVHLERIWGIAALWKRFTADIK